MLHLSMNVLHYLTSVVRSLLCLHAMFVDRVLAFHLHLFPLGSHVRFYPWIYLAGDARKGVVSVGASLYDAEWSCYGIIICNMLLSRGDLSLYMDSLLVSVPWMVYIDAFALFFLDTSLHLLGFFSSLLWWSES